jgi:hypothetical protein
MLFVLSTDLTLLPRASALQQQHPNLALHVGSGFFCCYDRQTRPLVVTVEQRSPTVTRITLATPYATHPERLEDAASFGSENPLVMIEITEAPATEVRIANDGAGWIPLYYLHDPAGHLHVSHALVRCLVQADHARPDPPSEFEYLVYNHPLEDKTLVAGARLLTPGMRLSWRRHGSLDVTRQPLFRFSASDSYASIDDIVAAFDACWAETCTRLEAIAGSNCALNLSGGFDSRLIANGVARLRKKLAVHVMEGNVRDLRTALAVAERLDFPRRVIKLDLGFSFSHYPSLLTSLSGAHSPFEMFCVWGIDRFPPDCAGLIEGVSGDVFWGNLAYGEGSADLASRIAGYYGKQRSSIRALLIGEAQTTFDTALSTSLEASVRSRPHHDGLTDALLWNIFNRQFRWGIGQNPACWEFGLDYVNPFYFRSFLEFARRIPAPLRHRGKAYQAILSRYCPETNDIPHSERMLTPSDLRTGIYQKPSLGMVKDILKDSKGSPQVAYRLARLLVTKLARRMRGGASSLDCESLFARQPTFRASVLDFLDSVVPLLPEYIDAAAFRREVEARQHGKGETPVQLLLRIGNVSRWRRLLDDVRGRGEFLPPGPTA